MRSAGNMRLILMRYKVQRKVEVQQDTKALVTSSVSQAKSEACLWRIHSALALHHRRIIALESRLLLPGLSGKRRRPTLHFVTPQHDLATDTSLMAGSPVAVKV